VSGAKKHGVPGVYQVYYCGIWYTCGIIVHQVQYLPAYLFYPEPTISPVPHNAKHTPTCPWFSSS
jgi:hypothetical protein